MENFTPISSYCGGVLIGIAATLLLLFNGRLMGVSGIIAQTLSPSTRSRQNLLFLFGIVAGAIIYRLVTGDAVDISVERSFPLIIISGFLSGFGARTGSGCTSGHGVCGIARLSSRSIVATITFMLFSLITVYCVQRWGGG